MNYVKGNTIDFSTLLKYYIFEKVLKRFIYSNFEFEDIFF